jgi:hypothetical protein
VTFAVAPSGITCPEGVSTTTTDLISGGVSVNAALMRDDGALTFSVSYAVFCTSPYTTWSNNWRNCWSMSRSVGSVRAMRSICSSVSGQKSSDSFESS